MQEKLKLASNNKVKKLPRERNTVKAALLRAMDDAQKDEWKKVIIVGISKTKTAIRHTTENDMTLLGLLETGKQLIYRDME